MKICPLMTRKESVQLCLANCALNVNGVCALVKSDDRAQPSKADQAQAAALLARLISRSR